MLFLQFAPLHLAGARLGQAGHKLHDARRLVNRHALAAPLNNFLLAHTAGKAGFEELLRSNKTSEEVRDMLVVLPVPLRSDPNFLAFPKSMQMKPWLAEFNQVIKRGYARGDIPKIISQNLGS